MKIKFFFFFLKKGNLAYGTLKTCGSFESYESSSNSNVKYARPLGSNKVRDRNFKI